MLCFFIGLPLQSTRRRQGLTEICGTNVKGVDRQLYKIVQRYTNDGQRQPPAIGLGDWERESFDWSPADYWVLFTASSPVGFRHGAWDTEHLSHCMGRREVSINVKIGSLLTEHKGFGLISADTKEAEAKLIHSILENRVGNITKRIDLVCK